MEQVGKEEELEKKRMLLEGMPRDSASRQGDAGSREYQETVGPGRARSSRPTQYEE